MTKGKAAGGLYFLATTGGIAVATPIYEATIV
jgi:hypothetical protein